MPSSRPVFVVGHGARGYDLSSIYELGIPILTSWQGADLIDNFHPLYYGRPGIYGQRTANKVLYEADQVIALGCRLSKWLTGHGGFGEKHITMSDVDIGEVQKFPSAVLGRSVLDTLALIEPRSNWVPDEWRKPLVEEAHADTKYINSYRFMARLEPLLRPDEVIVTDAGCIMCPVYQVLRVKPPQRLMTSGGLGEMGCALPAAIGAAFAGREVLAIVGDGGMMLNLQELGTIAHHNLPVKIIVFENDGYAMIRGTYTNMSLPRVGVDKASGISLPNFRKLAQAWGFPAGDIYTWNDFDTAIPQLLAEQGPALVVVHIDPEQAYVPRLMPTVKDGKMIPARYDQLSPHA